MKAFVLLITTIATLSLAISNVIAVLEGEKSVVILDVSNPTNPRIIQHYRSYEPVREIVTFGKMVMIISDGEMEILKLDTDGRIVSKEKIYLGGNVTDLDISGKIGAVGRKRGVMIFDNSFQTVSNLDLPWSVKSVRFFNERYLLAVLGKYGLAMIDLSDPLDPKWIWRLETKESVVSIDVSERYIYCLGESGLVFVVDLKDPEKPRVVSHTRVLPIGRKIVHSSGILYILSSSRNFEILDISDPFTPKLILKREFDIEVKDFIVNGNLVYISMEDGFYVMRFSGGELKVLNYSPAVLGRKFSKVVRIPEIGLKPGEIAWSYNTGSEIRSSPAFFDGVVYFTSMDGTLYSVTSDGSFKWSFKAKFLVNCSPVVDKLGRIYFGSWDNYLYAMDDRGNVLWRFRTGGDITHPPAVDGKRVYVGSEDGKLYALEGEEEVWSVDLDGWLSTNIVVGSDGTIYLGTSSGRIYAISYTGNVLWTFKAKGWISSSLAADENGNLYFGSVDNKLYSIDNWGKLIWKYDLGSDITAGPTLDSFGRVIVGTADGYLVSLSRKGEIMWKFKADGTIKSTPAVSREGYVYFGSEDGYLYSLNLDGYLRWKISTSGKVISSPLVIKNTVYFGSTDGKFYAVYDETEGLDDGPWPMYCGSQSHTKIM